jgi:hypothetical protein
MNGLQLFRDNSPSGFRLETGHFGPPMASRTQLPLELANS